MKKINIKNLKEIMNFVNKYPPYSDFNPISLYCWDTNNIGSFAITNNFIMIKIEDYLTKNFLVSVMGDGINKCLIEKLLNKHGRLSLVPEYVVKQLPESINVKEDKANFDYVLDLSAFTKLRGRSYKTIRKKIKKFTKEYSDYNLQIIDLTTKKTQTDVMRLTQDWLNNKNMKEDEKKVLESIKRYIDIQNMFRCINIGLFVKDKLIGYSFNEMLENNWGMGHFGRTDIEFKNSFLFLEYQADCLLHKYKIKYLNIQQDAGLEGLRKQKEQLNPSKFLKKYNITPDAKH